MKGSQIGMDVERESRKQEDKEEISRPHGIVLNTFQNTGVY